jgi:hypothetical protein
MNDLKIARRSVLPDRLFRFNDGGVVTLCRETPRSRQADDPRADDDCLDIRVHIPINRGGAHPVGMRAC